MDPRRVSLALALVALLVWPAAARAEVPLAADTLVYMDDDDVTVVTSQAAARHRWSEGNELGARVVVDVVSAASVDVVSQATRGFDETRVEAAVDGSRRLGDWTPYLAYRFSSEPDYVSHGGEVGWTVRLGGPDTVLAGRAGLTLDTVGVVDTSFDDWSRTLTTYTGEVGVTQVLDPRTLIRGVYTLTVQDGYMEKPYRFVPMFSAASLAQAEADGVALGFDTFDDYRLPERPPEEVPDLRVRHALFARGLRHLDGIDGAARLDYRFYFDSWGMTAHTVEAALSVPAGLGFTVEIRERAHLQTAVAFWERTYVVAEDGTVPRWRSADRELAGGVSSTTSGGVSWRHGSLSAYLEAGVMLTRFSESLYLDARTAFIGQIGVRVTP